MRKQQIITEEERTIIKEYLCASSYNPISVANSGIEDREQAKLLIIKKSDNEYTIKYKTGNSYDSGSVDTECTIEVNQMNVYINTSCLELRYDNEICETKETVYEDLFTYQPKIAPVLIHVVAKEWIKETENGKDRTMSWSAIPEVVNDYDVLEDFKLFSTDIRKIINSDQKNSVLNKQLSRNNNNF